MANSDLPLGIREGVKRSSSAYGNNTVVCDNIYMVINVYQYYCYVHTYLEYVQKNILLASR